MRTRAEQSNRSKKERGRRAKRSARPPGQVATERVGQRQRLLSQQPVVDAGAAAAGGGPALLATTASGVEVAAVPVAVVAFARHARQTMRVRDLHTSSVPFVSLVRAHSPLIALGFTDARISTAGGNKGGLFKKDGRDEAKRQR